MLAETEFIIRIVLAVALGILVGLEREMHERPAGLRTHVLVCVGAALFVTLAFCLTADAPDPTAQARVIAGVVTGIGFLGAGAIIRHKDKVEGLTTAADIWVIAAIGAAIGIGYYTAAAVTAVLVFIVLWFGKAVKHVL